MSQYDTIIKAIKDYFSVNKVLSSIVEDDVGLAKEDTLLDIKAQTDKLSFDTSNNLLAALNADNVGVAKDLTVQGIKAQTDKLSFDTSNNLLSAINADNVGLAKDLTVQGIKSQTDKLSFDQLSYLNTSYLQYIYDDSVTIDRTFSIPKGTFLKFSSITISSSGVVYGELIVGSRYLNIGSGIVVRVNGGGVIACV